MIECDSPKCGKWFNKRDCEPLFLQNGNYCSQECWLDAVWSAACDRPVLPHSEAQYGSRFNTSFCDAIAEGFYGKDKELEAFAKAMKAGEYEQAGRLMADAMRDYLDEAYSKQLERGFIQ